jgi:hypothetical protein
VSTGTILPGEDRRPAKIHEWHALALVRVLRIFPHGHANPSRTGTREHTMTTGETKEGRFLSALARFETCLETPVVPGELPTWLASAKKSCDEIGVLLRDEINSAHKKLLGEMARRDMALATRAEALKAKDSELFGQQNDIRVELESLLARADHFEPHESKLDEEVSRLVDAALGFVIEARKQNTALTTWYMEAFDRDRGVAD